MIWTDQTHVYTATDCPHLGRPCPAAERMVQALAGALAQARGATEDDFEVTGESLLDGCSRHCPARFAASHGRIRVFCGVPGSAPLAGLDRFADALMSPQGGALPASTAACRPCALAEALPVLATSVHRPAAAAAC